MFPVARDDGLIDVAIVKPASRTDALLFMDGAEVGKHFFSTSLRYFKVRSPSPPSFVLGNVAKKNDNRPTTCTKVECFRLTPLSPKGSSYPFACKSPTDSLLV